MSPRTNEICVYYGNIVARDFFREFKGKVVNIDAEGEPLVMVFVPTATTESPRTWARHKNTAADAKKKNSRPFTWMKSGC